VVKAGKTKVPMPEPEPLTNDSVSDAGSLIVTVLSQGTVNETVLVVCAPPLIVMVNDAVHAPNEAAGNEAVLQLVLASEALHPD